MRQIGEQWIKEIDGVRPMRAKHDAKAAGSRISKNGSMHYRRKS